MFHRYELRPVRTVAGGDGADGHRRGLFEDASFQIVDSLRLLRGRNECNEREKQLGLRVLHLLP